MSSPLKGIHFVFQNLSFVGDIEIMTLVFHMPCIVTNHSYDLWALMLIELQ